MTDTAFCTDVGQVKTGLGKADTYSRMLEEIHRVTPSIANGVARKYPDVQALVNAFRLRGESAIENIPVRRPFPLFSKQDTNISGSARTSPRRMGCQ